MGSIKGPVLPPLATYAEAAGGIELVASVGSGLSRLARWMYARQKRFI
jgi:hypothetical protein